MKAKLREIAAYSQPSSGLLIIALLLFLLYSACKIILGLIYKYITSGDMNQQKFYSIIAFCLLFILISALAYYGAKMLRNRIFENSLIQIRSRLFKDMVASFDHSADIGQWLTTVQTDAANLARFFPDLLLPFLHGLLMFGVAVIIGLFISPVLTIVITGTAALSVLISKYTDQAISAAYVTEKKAQENYQAYLENYLNHLPIIKIFAARPFFLKQYQQNLDQKNTATIHREYAVGKTVGLSISSSFTFNAFWISCAGLLIFFKHLEVGDFFYFLAVNDLLSWPFTTGIALLTQAKETRVSLERCQTLFPAATGSALRQSSATFEKIQVAQLALFKEHDWLLKPVSFEIQPGEKILITGPSGCGKSTLLNILTGVLKATQGEIWLDGQPTENLQALAIYYLSQRSQLLPISLLENVTMCPFSEVDQPKFTQILADCCLQEFIPDITFAKNQCYSEDLNLSQGQIQRLLVARACYSSSPLLVLDEFSANIDAANAQKILNYLLKEDRTILFTLHDTQLMAEENHFSKRLQLE